MEPAHDRLLSAVAPERVGRLAAWVLVLGVLPRSAAPVLPRCRFPGTPFDGLFESVGKLRVRQPPSPGLFVGTSRILVEPVLLSARCKRADLGLPAGENRRPKPVCRDR